MVSLRVRVDVLGGVVDRVGMLANDSVMNWVGLFRDNGVVSRVSMVQWVSLLSNHRVVNWVSLLRDNSVVGRVGLLSDDGVVNWLRHDSVVNRVGLVGNHSVSSWIGIHIVVLVVNCDVVVHWCRNHSVVVNGLDLMVCV